MAQLLQPLQYGTSLWTLGDGVFYPPGNDQVQATRMARGPGDELDTICGRTLLPSPPGTGHPVGEKGKVCPVMIHRRPKFITAFHTPTVCTVQYGCVTALMGYGRMP